MKNTLLLFVLIAIPTSIFAQFEDVKFKSLLKNCPEIGWDTYKCAPYIDLACYVQTLETDIAIKTITQYAKTYKFENQLIILTKMLLAPATNDTLRRPYIGGAVFIGGTDYSDWQTEPIILINDIPFLICSGYFLGGSPERAIDYFDYCLKNGTWTTAKYKQKSQEEYSAAVNTLLTSSIWKEELSSDEKEFFVNQK